MTKLKSKKMTKSTFAVIIMAILMVAMLAFGGTYAYFTASAQGKSASMTVGTVEIKTNTQSKIELISTYAVPGAKVADAATVDLVNTSTVDIYVFAKVTATVTISSVEQELFIRTGGEGTPEKPYTYASILSVALDETVDQDTTWAAIDATTYPNVFGYLYEAPAAVQGVVTPDEDGIASFVFDVVLSADIEEEHNEGTDGNIAISNNIFKYDSESEEYVSLGTTSFEGATINVKVTFSAIQAQNGETADNVFASAKEAYAAI